MVLKVIWDITEKWKSECSCTIILMETNYAQGRIYGTWPTR